MLVPGRGVHFCPMNTIHAMRQALELAQSVRGTTLPNPAVGAVVFDRKGKVVGVGATQPPGGKHAEVIALDKAGARANGGTLAVTLEPCVAFPGKRTPPCSGKILVSGIERLIVGSLDPNPSVHGKGVHALKRAGMEVIHEDLDGEVTDFYAGFAHHTRTGRPRVTLKIATSADGMATAAAGTPTAITGDQARLFTHRSRANSDWILIGKGTLLSDDPDLGVREISGRSPHRLVLWSGELPGRDFKLFHGTPTSFAGCGPRPTGLPKAVEWIELPGVRPNLADLLSVLGRRGVHDLFVEPGPGLLSSVLQANAWDRLWVLKSPKALPGGVPFDPAGLLPKTTSGTTPLGEDSAWLYLREE
jgi:diaminohydroxyphosphoribosylaminopyrimidine deaminase / 5-amino-6-(5-phosphoribosylamino)uracil reductase